MEPAQNAVNSTTVSATMSTRTTRRKNGQRGHESTQENTHSEQEREGENTVPAENGTTVPETTETMERTTNNTTMHTGPSYNTHTTVQETTGRLKRGNNNTNKGSRKNEIVRLAMKSKIKDSWDEIREQKRIEQQIWRQLRPKLREKGKENEYNRIWAEEKDRVYKELKMKKENKIKWIKSKYYEKEKVPDIIEGVIVKDQEIGEEFEMKVTKYGGVQLTKEEESILRVHPKYTILTKSTQ